MAGLASAYNLYSWADTAAPGMDDALVVLGPVFWFDTVDDVYQAVLNNAVSSPAEAHLINLTGRR